MNRLWSIAKKVAGGRPPVGATPVQVVARENKWRLLRYERQGSPSRYRTPVLLVPSLINRHYVLDLMPNMSFAQYMVQAGHDVFIIDWGTPGAEDRHLTFDTVCGRYLGRALRAVCQVAEVEQAHLLGYCMGGTLTAIHTAVYPERVASLVAMAAPIDFHDEGLLSTWTRTETFDVAAMVDALGNVPWPLMQASFHLLKPTMNFVKMKTLLQRATDDLFLDTFFAIETWGMDAVSFPGACYVYYIEQLYRQNALLRGTFTLNGRPARLSSIRCPTLAVTFEHDHIVPPSSAAVLLDEVGASRKERVHLNGGHVGAVINRRASTNLWPSLSNWWAESDTAITPKPVENPRAIPIKSLRLPLDPGADSLRA